MRIAAALLLLAACTGSAQAAPPRKAVPANIAPKPAETLMAADRAFSNLSASRGRGYAFLAFAANDARLFGTGDEPPIIGRAQAFRRLVRPQAKGVLRWTPAAAGVAADGTMGWTDGRWTYTPRSRRQGAAAQGHYLTVWTRQRGRWKVQANMSTTDPARRR